MKRDAAIFPIVVILAVAGVFVYAVGRGTSPVNAGMTVDPPSSSPAAPSTEAADPRDSSPNLPDHKPMAAAALTKQRHFDNEEDFDSPVSLPAEAWKLIVDAEDNSYFRDELLENSDPAYWVEASKIDIDLNGHDDYVVMGRKTPLMGANVANVYIITNAGGGKYEIVLNEPAKALFISDKRDRHGVRKVETLRMTYSEFFGTSYFFDGKQYQFKKTVRSKI